MAEKQKYIWGYSHFPKRVKMLTRPGHLIREMTSGKQTSIFSHSNIGNTT